MNEVDAATAGPRSLRRRYAIIDDRIIHKRHHHHHSLSSFYSLACCGCHCCCCCCVHRVVVVTEMMHHRVRSIHHPVMKKRDHLCPTTKIEIVFFVMTSLRLFHITSHIKTARCNAGMGEKEKERISRSTSKQARK